jgi:hypothetical protein
MTVQEEVWPSATGYFTAVRELRTAFPGRSELAGGTLRSGTVPGFPWSAAGANAIVFSLTTGSGCRVAVRCFTRRPQDDVDERYRALGSFLRSNPCPVFASFEWMDQAIIVEGNRWPILQMEWIDGDPLKLFVRQRLDRRPEIEQLSETWMSVVADLDNRRIAHGDLQHGNVIVASPSAMRLVDLDTVLCSSTVGYGTTESGLPAYQHPERAKRGTWDYRIDRFSAIVIYVSLRALASARRPVDLMSPGDSLVLSADDIKAAAEQDARDEAWEFLLKSPDPEVCRLAEQLHAACRSPLDDVPSLAEMVGMASRPDGGRIDRDPLPPGTALALNEWDPPAQAPRKLENLSPGAAPPAAPSGRRVKAEASHQQWSGGAEENAGDTGQAPQPPGTGAPSPSSQPTAAAFLLGFVLFLIGILVALLGSPEALLVSGGGVALIIWAAMRMRR